MEVFSCQVRLAGDLHNVHPIKAVTPAEILVLRSMHGGDAVVHVKKLADAKIGHRSERSRLRDKYGRKRVDALFPGALASLPETFEEIHDAEIPEKDEDAEETGLGRTPHVLEEIAAGRRDFGPVEGEGEGVVDDAAGAAAAVDDDAAAALADVFAGGEAAGE